MTKEDIGNRFGEEVSASDIIQQTEDQKKPKKPAPKPTSKKKTIVNVTPDPLDSRARRTTKKRRANPVEQADVQKVEEALWHLQNGDLAAAESILLDVCARCPDHYQYEYVEDNTRYIKFWDMVEFFHYVSLQPKDNKQGCVWLLSAYPRACYHLAFVSIERRDYPGAIQWLAKGRSLEPHNPKFLLESGVAYGQMNQHQQALDCFQQAMDLPRILPLERSMALRGMGVQLIDLGQLEEAEAKLQQSLALDPDNANTQRELTYISELRAGQPAWEDTQFISNPGSIPKKASRPKPRRNKKGLN